MGYIHPNGTAHHWTVTPKAFRLWTSLRDITVNHKAGINEEADTHGLSMHPSRSGDTGQPLCLKGRANGRGARRTTWQERCNLNNTRRRRRQNKEQRRELKTQLMNLVKWLSGFQEFWAESKHEKKYEQINLWPVIVLLYLFVLHSHTKRSLEGGGNRKGESAYNLLNTHTQVLVSPSTNNLQPFQGIKPPNAKQ